MEKATSPEQLKKLNEVLNSRHVSSVECRFEYEADGARYYTAISRKGFERHRYLVKLGEDSDGNRFGGCNCAAGSKDQTCRHILKAAELDTQLFGIPLHTETVEQYKAYLKYEQRAA
jgi:hypothetical protein